MTAMFASAMFASAMFVVGGGQVAATTLVANRHTLLFTRDTDMTQRSRDEGQAPAGIDQQLVRRWAELFAYVLAEFRADRRDATAAIEGDYSTRRIRVLRSTGDDRWVDRTLTEQELRTTDLRALAKRLYAESIRR
jgi:hypothetical protein